MTGTAAAGANDKTPRLDKKLRRPGRAHRPGRRLWTSLGVEPPALGSAAVIHREDAADGAVAELLGDAAGVVRKGHQQGAAVVMDDLLHLLVDRGPLGLVSLGARLQEQVV